MIVQDIRADMNVARKERDSFKSVKLATILGDLMANAEFVDGEKLVTDEIAIRVLKKYIKGIDEMISVNPSDSEALLTEKGIYEKYLPSMLTEDDLRSIIEGLVTNGASKLSDIMKVLKEKYANLYDGKLASKLAKEALDKSS